MENIQRSIKTLKEDVFPEIRPGRNPERLLNKTVQGFTTHIAAKITSHTLRILPRHV